MPAEIESPRYHLRCSSRYFSPAKRVRFHSRDGRMPVSSPSMSTPVLLAEAQLRQEARGVVDVGLARQHVVVRVARHDDRLVHVDRAVAARLVVAEAIRRPRQLEEARIADRVLRRALARRQRAERQERLDRRARRVRAAQRAIEQRLVGRLVERFPVRGIDAVDEQVGVVARLAHEREDVAGGGLDRDQRAAAVAERLLRDFLQLDVERQRAGCCRTPAACATACARRGRPRRPRLPRSRSCRAARARSDSSTPDLADVVGALVVGGLAPTTRCARGPCR